MPVGTSKRAVFQCDASDKRKVLFADGTFVETTCLLVNEFDIVAVNLHGFYGSWEFVFAKNSDLPRVTGLHGKSREYTAAQRDMLLASSVHIFYPHAGAIFHKEPWMLFDSIIEERKQIDTPTPFIIE